MSLQLPAPPKELTVRDLREYLDAVESVWTMREDYYLGSFDDARLHVMAYAEVDDTGYYIQMGLQEAGIHYDSMFGFLVKEK